MALTVAVDPEHPEDRPLVLAAEVLQAGGVIVYPTDTLYGIGADALNAVAVERVRRVKQRTTAKPILILVPDQGSVELLVAEIPAPARRLMDAFWPGPMTLVFRALPGLPGALTQGGSTIGVRVPSSSLCLRLLRLAGSPMTSTSANLAGEPSRGTIAEIRESLGATVDLYLDAGPLTGVLPSTVIDVTAETPRLIREGAIAAEDLRAIVPSIER
jgi:L-threonylcarbamoyladenylate synthase